MSKFRSFITRAEDELHEGKLTRREFIKSVAAFGASIGVVLTVPQLTGCSGGATSEEALELTWINEEGIADPAFLGDWNKEHKTQIRNETYLSESALAAQVASGQKKVDLAVVSMGYAQNYWYPTKTLHALNPNDYPHWNDLYEYFQKWDWCYDNGELMSISQIWGTDSLIHNKEFIPEVTSYDVIFDPQYKGKIAMPKNVSESVAITAMYLGYKDPFNPSDAELVEIEKVLINQKPLVKTYWETIGDVMNLFTAKEIYVAQGWWPMYTQLKKAGMDMAWAHCKEGEISWANGDGILKSTKYYDTCVEFMDYIISPSWLEPMYRKIGYRTTSKAFTESLTPQERTDLGMDNIEGFLSGLIPWVTPAEDRGQKMDDMWARVLAA